MPPATVLPDAATIDLKAEALADLNATEKFFDRTTRCLAEADSAFRATPVNLTVSAHIAHVALSIDWLREGALHDRWDMDFERHIAEAMAVTSLVEAQSRLALAFSRTREELAGMDAARLAETMASNEILPGRPRFYLVSAISDHTAHHRGALAVYARLLGKEPLMPYGED